MFKLKSFAKINSSRHKLSIFKNSLSKTNSFIKTYSKGIHLKQGRNVHGRITTRHRGGRHKILYRALFSSSLSFQSILISTFYDPIRTSFLSLNFDLKYYTFFFYSKNS